MDLGLKGRTVIVTGSGRGIGLACARVFAREGANICINDVNEEAGRQAAEEIARDFGVKTLFAGGSVSDEGAVKALFQGADQAFGRIDVLVNNAAISPKTPFEQITPEEFRRVLDVNLNGVFLCTQEAVRYMKPRGWGRIVNLSSLAGRYGGRFSGTHYASSKAGILGMTMSLGKALGPYGITVNSVAPGRIDTELTRVLPEETKKQILAQIPLGRFGTAEDCGNVIAFLASEPGGYVTGTNVDIMGGYIA